ncbi:MAG: hypothetical protein CM15mP23_15880 [Cryomorphaceae bacterium]|nr:MAG: hypothetical protein CM15mP23_15880 [Cryomorphaceae bacterium]
MKIGFEWVTISSLIHQVMKLKLSNTFGYKLIDGNLKIDVHHSFFLITLKN